MATGSGRAGACARCPRTRPPTTRSRTQRHGLAPRQFPDRRRPGALRPVGGGTADRPRDARGGDVPRPRAYRRCSRGLPRGETPFPIAYPTAARPQAWAGGHACAPPAAAALGLRPEGGKLVTAGPPVPEWGRLAAALGRARLRRVVGRPTRGRPGHRRMRIAVISPVWFPVPPTGYGGIEWIVWLLADGLVDCRPRRDPLRQRRLAHEGQARLVFEHAPSARIGNTLPELHHCLACYERAGRLRRDQRPLRSACSVDRGLIDKPVLHTVHGPLDGEGGVIYEQIARVAPEIRAHLGLDEPAQAEAGPPLGRQLSERARLLALPRQAAPRRLPALPRPMSPDKGCHRAIDVAVTAGLPLKIAGKNREPLERQYFDESSPRTSRTRSSTWARSPREKVELLTERARDALPDRVGGAVRPGDDRVDGVRDAGDRDPLGRRSRGDRARAERDHRRRLRDMAAAIEEADRLDPFELVRYAHERFSPERMVADYLRAFRSVVGERP